MRWVKLIKAGIRPFSLLPKLTAQIATVAEQCSGILCCQVNPHAVPLRAEGPWKPGLGGKFVRRADAACGWVVWVRVPCQAHLLRQGQSTTTMPNKFHLLVSFPVCYRQSAGCLQSALFPCNESASHVETGFRSATTVEGAGGSRSLATVAATTSDGGTCFQDTTRNNEKKRLSQWPGHDLRQQSLLVTYQGAHFSNNFSARPSSTAGAR